MKKPQSVTLRLCGAAATSLANLGCAADEPVTIAYGAHSAPKKFQAEPVNS